MPHKYRLGRKPRAFRPEVPHWSSLAMRRPHLPILPVACDYLSNLPDDVGMMLNDRIGDCTIAAIYHAIQIWTAQCARLQTSPDGYALYLYEKFCGYNPADPSTDQGGIEQTVLRDWLRKGVPTITGRLNRLSAWIEVDPRNLDDIKRAIDECGVCYIGFGVGSNIMPPDGSDPPLMWNYDPAASEEGGHAVVLGAYDSSSFGLISWGNPRYRMSFDYFRHWASEAYALVDVDWVTATGKTPLGMDLATLTRLMLAIRSH